MPSATAVATVRSAFPCSAPVATLQLRYSVWEGEGSICSTEFPDQCWLDKDDETGRHWVVTRTDTNEVR